MNRPPAECPMMMGGRSSSLITLSSLSMISVTSSCSIGVGSSRSAPTSTPKPGYAGVNTS